MNILTTIIVAAIASGLITAVVMRFLDRKKFKADVKKTEVDIRKSMAEIESIKTDEKRAVIDSFATVAATIDGLLTQMQRLTEKVQEGAVALQECKESEAELRERVKKNKTDLQMQIAKMESEMAEIKQQVSGSEVSQ